ncbi:hypothetical protein AN958_07854 [Leucoagaricus sp. SymC.cos]|nr:hypothetical protein AN958_07854 [Leucoagaricus sp. SymC.cos]
MTRLSWNAYIKRFMPLVTRSRNTDKRDIWAFGYLSYQALSGKLPHYQFPDEDIETKHNEGELVVRPDGANDEIDQIDDKGWELIMKCCSLIPEDQPDWSQIQQMITGTEIEDDRPPTTNLPIPEIVAMTSCPELDFRRAETILNYALADVLREPLSGFIKNPTKDVATAVIELAQDDILTMVNFLGQVLKETLSISDGRNRVLAILSKVTSSSLIFPQCYELKGIIQGPRRYIGEGGCGIVYQVADPTVCTKATLKPLDTGALMVSINRRGYPMGSFVTSNFFTISRGISQGSVESPQTCLVSPFMKIRKLRVYAAKIPQKSRLPLISDVANGLQYLHALGVVHGDLKELRKIWDDRPTTKVAPGTDILKLRVELKIDLRHVEELLGQVRRLKSTATIPKILKTHTEMRASHLEGILERTLNEGDSVMAQEIINNLMPYLNFYQWDIKGTTGEDDKEIRLPTLLPEKLPEKPYLDPVLLDAYDNPPFRRYILNRKIICTLQNRSPDIIANGWKINDDNDVHTVW